MKKMILRAIILLMVAAMVAVTVSCGTTKEQSDENAKNNNMADEIGNQTSSQNGEVAEHENRFEIEAPSLQDLVNQLVGDSVQSANQDTIFVKAANSANLSFSDYDVQYVVYTPYETDDGVLNGNISLDVYWHEKDCKDCAAHVAHSVKFWLCLIYHKDGIDQAAATIGYCQTDDVKFYTKELDFDKTSYVYLINNQYYCLYVINNDLPQKELVCEQLAAFCTEIEASLKKHEQTS